MKVKVRNINPNPYRNIDHYPLNKEKIMALTNSIEKTGFWDNLVGREINGEIQIAYGHHRVEALRLAEGFGYDFEFDLPIKDIDDGTMIQIMANENMQEWGHSIGVVDETVKVAKEYLELAFSEKRKSESKGREDYKNKINAPELAEFLGWSLAKVHNSLKRLNLINEGSVEREAVEALPSETHATNFAKEIAKSEVEFTPKEQKQIAKEINDEEITTKGIKHKIHSKAIDKKYPKLNPKKDPNKARQERVKDFEGYLRSFEVKINDLYLELQDISEAREILKDVSKENIVGRWSMVTSIKKFAKKSNELLEFLKEEK